MSDGQSEGYRDTCAAAREREEQPRRRVLPKVAVRVLGVKYAEVDGHLTVAVRLQLPESEAEFGGIPLTTKSEKHGGVVGTAAGADFIARVCRLLGETPDRIGGETLYALLDGIRVEGLQRFEIDGGAMLLLQDWRAEWSI